MIDRPPGTFQKPNGARHPAMCLELCLISSVHMEQPQIARGTKGRDGENSASSRDGSTTSRKAAATFTVVRLRA
jgi:hypothetical protein